MTSGGAHSAAAHGLTGGRQLSAEWWHGRLGVGHCTGPGGGRCEEFAAHVQELNVCFADTKHKTKKQSGEMFVVN